MNSSQQPLHHHPSSLECGATSLPITQPKSAHSTADNMDAQQTSHSLFEVYLRLRPTNTVSTSGDRFLDVDAPEPGESAPKHITLNPPADRRRAVEKFAFTQVFEEDATQLDVFHCTGVASLVEGVLAPYGDGTDALLATLGVTGSGKVRPAQRDRRLREVILTIVYHCRHTPCWEHAPSAASPKCLSTLSTVRSATASLIPLHTQTSTSPSTHPIRQKPAYFQPRPTSSRSIAQIQRHPSCAEAAMADRHLYKYDLPLLSLLDFQPTSLFVGPLLLPLSRTSSAQEHQLDPFNKPSGRQVSD